MLERLLTRRSLVFGVQILAGVAAAFTLDLAFAQSPAVMGVYNTATAFGGGVSATPQLSIQGQDKQGINAFGGNTSSTMNGMSGTMGGMNVQNVNQKEWEPLQVDTPEYVYRGHEEKHPITSLCFYNFPDGTDAYAILSASADKTARLWIFEGKYDPETTEWFVTNGRQRKVYKDVHRQGLTSAIFSPDNRYVLTSSYDQIGRLWNLNNQENIRAYLGAKDRLWSIGAANSGEFVAGACNDGRIYFWKSLTVDKLGSLPNREDASKLGGDFENVGHDGPVFDIDFSPNGDFIASAGADGTVRMWNIALQRQVAVIKASEDKVYSVKFSNDGSLLLTASRDKSARLFNAVTGEEVCRFVGHTGAVHKAIFAGNYIATASDDGTARLWSSQAKLNSNNSSSSGTGTSVSMMNGGYPDELGAPVTGKRTSSAGKPSREPGKVKGTELACFNAGVPTFSVAVSSDSVYLVSGGSDGLARVWRIPGNGRYYGDGGYNNSNSASGFGTDPMANPDNTLPNGNMSGELK